MPSWSRRSMKHRPPRSRATSAQPHRVTVWPQKWVRMGTPDRTRAGRGKPVILPARGRVSERCARFCNHRDNARIGMQRFAPVPGRPDMIAIVRPLAALLAGAALLLMGSGLLGTLLAVRGRIEGYEDQVLGLVMSAYFAGFFLGTYAAPGLIQRIGHIRAFAFYAALCAATVLLHPVLVSPWAWGLLRLSTGIALVGLYTVIESWLNVQAPAGQRSQVFAIYMAVSLLAMAAGQWLIGVAPPGGFVLFSLVAILICAAALPVTASRMTQPELPPMPRLALRALLRAAPAATLGALLAGLTLGSFWGLAAVFA